MRHAAFYLRASQARAHQKRRHHEQQEQQHGNTSGPTAVRGLRVQVRDVGRVQPARSAARRDEVNVPRATHRARLQWRAHDGTHFLHTPLMHIRKRPTCSTSGVPTSATARTRRPSYASAVTSRSRYPGTSSRPPPPSVARSRSSCAVESRCAAPCTHTPWSGDSTSVPKPGSRNGRPLYSNESACMTCQLSAFQASARTRRADPLARQLHFNAPILARGKGMSLQAICPGAQLACAGSYLSQTRSCTQTPAARAPPRCASHSRPYR